LTPVENYPVRGAAKKLVNIESMPPSKSSK
jgi:hypothetical protein